MATHDDDFRELGLARIITPHSTVDTPHDNDTGDDDETTTRTQREKETHFGSKDVDERSDCF